ncbi:hypothetical protein D477_010891 [Arthrobacter crystallopoietes BAB-32]|uniref:DUF3180 domain-containing protein n=1 Tax=Arthrobacter crystallopoietes BAB-32 TaxID=1246476 RepID=N1UUU1_9MICC|nr:DUF3180 domain-containing protein [Arthrobacter crystallopoietes]EMY34191.1 hypothetical protein D477_010891 [Arthrobacter crystallopoietes BAB-32]
MRTIKYSWLAIIALCAGVLGWLGNLLTLRNGLPVPVLHLSSLATMAAVVIFTLALGLRVRSWRNGKRNKPLDPILAARTLVLAQACAYAGSLLLGWHAGILVDQLVLLTFRPASAVLLQVLAMMGGGLVMVVVGLVVERFCKLPPEDPEAAERERRSAEGEGEYA